MLLVAAAVRAQALRVTEERLAVAVRVVSAQELVCLLRQAPTTQLRLEPEELVAQPLRHQTQAATEATLYLVQLRQLEAAALAVKTATAQMAVLVVAAALLEATATRLAFRHPKAIMAQQAHQVPRTMAAAVVVALLP